MSVGFQKVVPSHGKGSCLFHYERNPWNSPYHSPSSRGQGETPCRVPASGWPRATGTRSNRPAVDNIFGVLRALIDPLPPPTAASGLEDLRSRKITPLFLVWDRHPFLVTGLATSGHSGLLRCHLLDSSKDCVIRIHEKNSSRNKKNFALSQKGRASDKAQRLVSRRSPSPGLWHSQTVSCHTSYWQSHS